MVSNGIYHYLMLAVAKAEMTDGKYFTLLATACDEVPNVVYENDDPWLLMKPGGVLVPTHSEARGTIKEIVIYAFLRESY